MPYGSHLILDSPKSFMISAYSPKLNLWIVVLIFFICSTLSNVIDLLALLYNNRNVLLETYHRKSTKREFELIKSINTIGRLNILLISRVMFAS